MRTFGYYISINDLSFAQVVAHNFSSGCSLYFRPGAIRLDNGEYVSCPHLWVSGPFKEEHRRDLNYFAVIKHGDYYKLINTRGVVGKKRTRAYSRTKIEIK